MATKEKRYYLEYDVVRVIVTLLVIISHCTYYELGSPNEGEGYLALIDPKLSPFYSFAIQVKDIIYLFHMSLYMALSGALFRNAKLNGGGYSSCKDLISNKAKKLLLPFVTVLAFYAVPVKALAGFYSRANTLGDIIQYIMVNELFIQKGFYLWFLPVLFVIFILIYWMEKYWGASRKIKLLILLVISYGYRAIPLNVVSLTVKWAVWFYVGYCFEGYREQINLQIKEKRMKLFPILLLFFAGFVIIRLIPNPEGFDFWIFIRKPLETLCAVSGCLSVYFISYSISRTKISQNKVFQLIRANTFGLYLFSDPWNYSVLAVMTALFGKDVFVTNWGSALTYFIRMFVTAGMGLAVSMSLKKVNKKYYRV